MWSKAPPPTKEEAARIELAKTGPCMACLALQMQDLLDPELVVYGCDYNHAKSGNLRRGHMFGYATLQVAPHAASDGREHLRDDAPDLRPEPDGWLADLPRDVWLR